MIRLLLAALTVIAAFGAAYSQEYVPNEILVSFVDKSTVAFMEESQPPTCIYSQINAYLESIGVSEIIGLTHASAGARNIYLLRFGADIEESAVIARLQQFSEVKSAGLNYTLEFFVDPNDYYYNNDWHMPSGGYIDQWYLKTIQCDRAWDIEQGSPEVKVVILDTGVDYFHPDLISNIWVNPAEDLDNDGEVWDLDDMDGEDSPADADTLRDNLIGWDFMWRDNDPYPDSTYTEARHGTMMSTFFARGNNDLQPGDTSLAGMAWHCKIVPLKTGNVCNNLIEALDLAISIGAQIVNMSGACSGYNPEMQEAVEAAYANGITMVAAEGDFPDMPWYPAAFPEVIAVSGVDETGTKCSGLGYHSYVDVCGVNGVQSEKELIMTTLDIPGFEYLPPLWPGTQYPHTYRNQGPSTSCSCAQVSAVAALLKSRYPNASPQFIKQEIMRGAIPVDTAQGNDGQLWQYMLGAGRINPYRSLTQWGRIRSDTTWASFAYVSGDIKIDEGKTLTIEPGTTIYFAPEDNDNTYDPTVVEFRVDGTLIAEGTESNPIVFKSLSQDPQPGDWSGLQIIGTAASASLSYCNVSDGFMGVKSKRPVEVSHCNISNCQVFGIYLLYGGANGSEISDCTMTGNGGSGIWIYSSDNVSVSGCTCDNNPRGIWLGSSTGSSILNTVLKSSLTDGLKASDGSSIMINGCTIESNGQQGIYLSNSNASISHTKIWKNTANGLYCTGALSNPEVEYSKIEQNAVGVRAISPACPILGDIERSIGQYNAIYNQPLFVYGHHDCLIMAENCWWGTKPGKPPSLSKFLGDVDYYPWLDSDPVPYLAPSAPQKSTTLSLAQNFPNPSVGSGITRISYSIPSGNENTRVLLAIYDVTGRRIRTLVDEAKGTGTYQAYWDGKGDRGKTAAPGIYFYKLTVGKSSISKKLILFR